MKINIGYLDQTLRAVVGLIIVGVGFELNSEWGIIGFLPLLTAFLLPDLSQAPYQHVPSIEGINAHE